MWVNMPIPWMIWVPGFPFDDSWRDQLWLHHPCPLHLFNGKDRGLVVSWVCLLGVQLYLLSRYVGCKRARTVVQEISNGRTHVSRTPQPEYLIARSQLAERGPLGSGPIQFLMELWKLEVPQRNWTVFLLECPSLSVLRVGMSQEMDANGQ